MHKLKYNGRDREQPFKGGDKIKLSSTIKC